MTARSAFGSYGDRLLAVAFVLMVTLGLAGIASSETGATFTGTTTNPNNHFNTMLVQPPAAQNAPTPGAGGIVNLSWSATPTAPGTGHTLSYNVLRGPVGGPYTQLTNVSALSYTDTPPADGTYQYVIQAKVSGGGTFTSGNSSAQNGTSDRTAPTMGITCNGAACSTAWYNAAITVVVTGTDTGTGMGSVTRNVDGAGQVSAAGASATFTVSGNNANHSVVYFGTDAAGNSSGSGTQILKIDGTAPTAATGVSSTSGGGGGSVTVDLSWTAGTDALSGVAGYTVRRSNAVSTCPAASVTNYPNTTSVGAVTSTTISTGMTSGSKYCFYLVTNDNAGNASANSAVTGPTTAR